MKIGGMGGACNRSKASHVIALAEHVWLTLVGPEMKAGRKTREGGFPAGAVAKNLPVQGTQV